ncbi:MAG: phosphatidylglycerol lysyltransferase domain-containing protein [Eubacterium sp.]|nr:phosphatidylglycerol lysyltransferase domain-containing protein [Eubacterium sp.]
MLDFKLPELSDKRWVDECLKHAGSISCEYTFGNTFIWQKVYGTEICRYKDFFICAWSFDGSPAYSLPLGEGDFTDAVNQIINDAKERGVKARIYGVTSGYLDMLRESFTGKFKYKFNDAFSDYIYLTEKMALLSGKKYHGKRNHISNFKKNNPDWKFELITRDNIGDCIELHKRWLDEKDGSSNEDYTEELSAVLTAFESYEELGFVGGLIRVNGEAVAYTMGEPHPASDCFVTHFEKAVSSVQGAYAIINQEFTRNCLLPYKYVNREEDLGIEGLRRAKLSYNPEIILEKGVAVYND